MMAIMDESSKERLLENGSEHDEAENQDDFAFRSGRPPSVSAWWRIAFLALLSVNAIVSAWWYFSPSKVLPNTLWKPAIDAISYSKQRIWRPLPDNVYAGEPRPEMDDAWRSLIRPMAVKISSSEAQQLGEETIAFKDGSGYMAEVAVFHELHCIKRLKQHLHLDYYHPNMTAEEAEKEEVHIDHCFEYLRKAAMCRGDTSLATFFWKDGKPKSRNWSDHVCVDWEKLYSFAMDRSVLITDYEGIEGPPEEDSG